MISSIFYCVFPYVPSSMYYIDKPKFDMNRLVQRKETVNGCFMTPFLQ